MNVATEHKNDLSALEHIRIFGNTALVKSKTNYTKTANGETVKGSSVYTDTYIKENGRWWCVQADTGEVG